MKHRKKKPTMDGIEFDSKEEVEFYIWCKEAKEHGLILSFNYHPEPFELSDAYFIFEMKQLKTKTKEVKRSLFRAHGYQPDFVVYGKPSFLSLPHGLLSEGATKPHGLSEPAGNYSLFYVDIKPSYDPQDSRKALFSINQKWVYSKYGIYINKVVPKEFFAKTFAPNIRHKTTGRSLEKYANCRSVEDVDHEPIEMEFN